MWKGDLVALPPTHSLAEASTRPQSTARGADANDVSGESSSKGGNSRALVVLLVLVGVLVITVAVQVSRYAGAADASSESPSARAPRRLHLTHRLTDPGRERPGTGSRRPGRTQRLTRRHRPRDAQRLPAAPRSPSDPGVPYTISGTVSTAAPSGWRGGADRRQLLEPERRQRRERRRRRPRLEPGRHDHVGDRAEHRAIGDACSDRRLRRDASSGALPVLRPARDEQPLVARIRVGSVADASA